MTSMHRWVCALVAALLVATPALGQEYRGRVQGSLTDETQLAVPGAQVTLRNDATGVSVTRTTGPEGRYLFDYVDPGTYTLTAELSGFATVVQRNVVVQARGDVTADVMMKVAALSETVTVETQPIAIQFNTSTKDLTLDQSFLESIPNITRNPTQLAYLSPVVRNAGNKNEVSPYHHWAGNDMDIGGGTRRRNDVLLDGTPLEAGPKVAYTPPMDAIAEFNVSTNAVDAEFGHSAGGIISMSLKSGTNAYHGTGYYVGRNADWNAVTNRVTRQHSDNTLQPDRRHDRDAASPQQGLPLHQRRIVPRDGSAAAIADDADRARAAGRLLAVVQPRRHRCASSTIRGRRGSARTARSFAIRFPATRFRRTASIRSARSSCRASGRRTAPATIARD